VMRRISPSPIEVGSVPDLIVKSRGCRSACPASASTDSFWPSQFLMVHVKATRSRQVASGVSRSARALESPAANACSNAVNQLVAIVAVLALRVSRERSEIVVIFKLLMIVVTVLLIARHG